MYKKNANFEFYLLPDIFLGKVSEVGCRERKLATVFKSFKSRLLQSKTSKRAAFL